MADTPPLKEGDEEPPGTMYALVGPATDDGEVGMASGCGYPSGLTTLYEVQAVLLMELISRWKAVFDMGGEGCWTFKYHTLLLERGCVDMTRCGLFKLVP